LTLFVLGGRSKLQSGSWRRGPSFLRTRSGPLARTAWSPTYEGFPKACQAAAIPHARRRYSRIPISRQRSMRPRRSATVGDAIAAACRAIDAEASCCHACRGSTARAAMGRHQPPQHSLVLSSLVFSLQLRNTIPTTTATMPMRRRSRPLLDTDRHPAARSH